MSSEHESTNKKQSAPLPVIAASDASKHSNVTLCNEDIDLLNKCSKNYNKRVAVVNTAWLGVGYFLGRVGIFPNFISLHPLIYFGMITCSYTTQNFFFDNYSKTCEDEFINSDLRTPFAQFVRHNGWPNLFGYASVKLLLEGADKERTKQQTYFGSLLSWKSKDKNGDNKS